MRRAQSHPKPGTTLRHYGTLTKIALLALALFCSEASADLSGAIAAYRRGDFAVAFAEFQDAAIKDDPLAQNALGTMYAQGLGVQRDDGRAVDWFFKAQALGFPEAAANLGAMYEAGLGLPRDANAALKYYREAASADNQPAISRLAKIYENGELGVTPDIALARQFRSRLGEIPAAPRKLDLATAKAAAMPAKPPKPVPALAAGPDRDKTIRARLDAADAFEKQLLRRLEQYRLRERRLFVASGDNRPALKAYLDELRTLLRGRLASAFAAAGEKEMLLVTLSIRRDGTLAESQMDKGSGNARTDTRVLAALKKLPHLSPLPEELAASIDVLAVTIRLPVAQ